MRLADEPGFPVLPPGQPTRDLLLAQALDTCIAAERRLPGSSQEIIARQPAWARGELRRLVGLAGSLDAAASNALMSSEYRVAARSRLMRRIGGDPDQVARGTPAAPVGVVRLSPVAASRDGAHAAATRKPALLKRVSAGLVAAALAAAATLTASASALPGEPLYNLKQAQEELALRLAVDDQQRSLALLRQADARLDETTRLLEQGRTLDATATTLRYDQVVQRATMSYVGAIDDTPAPAPASAGMEASLSQNQDRLQALLESAPELARGDLREALVATERGRALVADPRPVERALGRADRGDSAIAAAIPTMAAEDAPTLVPTVAVENPRAAPTRRPVLGVPTPTPAVVLAETHDDDAGVMTPVVAQVDGTESRGGEDGGSGSGTANVSRGGPPQSATAATSGAPAHGSIQHVDDAPATAPQANSSDSVDGSGPQANSSDSVDGSGPVDARGGSADHTRVADRPDVAVQGSADRAPSPQAGADDPHMLPGPQGDRSVRGDDPPQPAVAHPMSEPVPARSAPTQAAGPDRHASGDGHTSSPPPASVGAHAAATPAQTQTVRPAGDGQTAGDANSKAPAGSGAGQPTPGSRTAGDNHPSSDSHPGGGDTSH